MSDHFIDTFQDQKNMYYFLFFYLLIFYDLNMAFDNVLQIIIESVTSISSNTK